MSDKSKLDKETNEETGAVEEVEKVEEVEETDASETTTRVEVSELEKLQDELVDLKDQNLRLQAEIQNVQRRMRKNREEAEKYKSQSLATELIPAIDNLERVLDVETTSEEADNFKKGVEMTLTAIKQAFKSQDIELIEPEIGAIFDPTIHEATAMVPAMDEQESGTVAEVLQRGYSLNGRILRPARVAVTQ